MEQILIPFKAWAWECPVCGGKYLMDVVGTTDAARTMRERCDPCGRSFPVILPE